MTVLEARATTFGAVSIVNAIASGRPLVLYGGGTQQRDFTYVEDVVALNLKAARAKMKGIGKLAGLS